MVRRLPADGSVGERESVVPGMKSAVSSGQIARDLVRDDPSGQLVAEVERLDRLAARELVQAGTHAPDAHAEPLDELAGRAVVVAVRQQDVSRRPVLREPLDPVDGRDRIDQDALPASR